ncbi:uncharacterized protein F5147DRAFT_793648 [Suillus discolor]|uniref:Uncharacterized protein n=1 Tax=Suillus discolor TaxID=1912936 RepID=A0A9P7ESE1_9AGAM|nr:uncharacterized protein F5147DRAFT_793648 [Suillus discolor]KAG2085468.1 hypothetical protein F5147DRAFT_793648 [Suillus discolor]
MAPRRTTSQPRRTSKQKAPPRPKKNSALNASGRDITSQLGLPQDRPQTPDSLRCPPNMDDFHPEFQSHSQPQPPLQNFTPAQDYLMGGDYQDQYYPPQDQFYPPQDDYHPPQHDYHPPQDQYYPPQDHPPQHDYHPPQDDYHPPQDQYYPPQDHPPQHDYHPLQDHPPQHDYHPPQDQPLQNQPPQDQYYPPQDEHPPQDEPQPEEFQPAPQEDEGAGPIHEDLDLHGHGLRQHMRWDLRDVYILRMQPPQQGPQIVGVTIPRKREVDRGEFSQGVIHELRTSQTVGRLGTRPVDRHLPLTPSSVLAPAPQPLAPAETPPTPAHASSPSPAPAPDSSFVVELDKPTINSIKHTTKEELWAVIDRALKKARIPVIGQVKYKPFEKKRVLCEELVTCMSNMQRTFRDYAANIVQTALNLRLPISAEPQEEAAHKIAVVPILLKDLNFLHKFELDDDGIKQCQLLEADYFVEMIINVVWQKGLYE